MWNRIKKYMGWSINAELVEENKDLMKLLTHAENRRKAAVGYNGHLTAELNSVRSELKEAKANYLKAAKACDDIRAVNDNWSKSAKEYIFNAYKNVLKRANVAERKVGSLTARIEMVEKQHALKENEVKILRNAIEEMDDRSKKLHGRNVIQATSITNLLTENETIHNERDLAQKRVEELEIELVSKSKTPVDVGALEKQAKSIESRHFHWFNKYQQLESSSRAARDELKKTIMTLHQKIKKKDTQHQLDREAAHAMQAALGRTIRELESQIERMTEDDIPETPRGCSY